MADVFRILDRLRAGVAPSPTELREVVAGSATGALTDAQIGAFLMGLAIHGLDGSRTAELTRAMVESGESWELGTEIPRLGDKHSTGGVGDKVSLILGPLLAACDRPVVMLTGRGLGHTGGTADKLETIPGLSLDLDRAGALERLRTVGLAVGVPTARIAPADRVLYRLRDVTGTVRSLPLVVGSILSKKLATGASGLVLDVKVGSGAFFQRPEDAGELARLLVRTADTLGLRAGALVTDMSQPLGRWAGHTVEVREALDCLAGDGPDDLTELSLRLARELADLVGAPVPRDELEAAISSGAARERFDRWAEAQGADPAWIAAPRFAVAPDETVLRASRSGVLAGIDAEGLGRTLAQAGGGRARPEDAIDPEIALRLEARLGDPVEAGAPLARLYLRRKNRELSARAAACFEIADEADGEATPPLIHERVSLDASRAAPRTGGAQQGS